MTRIVNFLLSAFFVINYLNLANANENPEFRGANVELKHDETPTDGVLVVNNRTEFGVQKPYTKYTLFKENQTTYFNADGFTLEGEKVKINGWRLRGQYVYDVFTYWSPDDTILLVALRYHQAEYDSRFKYYMLVRGKWTEVDGEIYGADRKGLINVESLTELLGWIEKQNNVDTTEPKAAKKPLTARKTLLIVGVVLGIIAVLMLIGLFFFLKK